MNALFDASQIQANPFVILTLIVAPAILTNASAMMILSTSNRFARAIDRARDVSRQLEAATDKDPSLLTRLKEELLVTEKRAVLLLQAIRLFYFSLGAFAFAAFVSLVGAGLVNLNMKLLNSIFAVLAVLTVFLAAGGLVLGSVLLFQESRITVGILKKRIEMLRAN